MLVAILLDEKINSNIIDYINSFKKDNELIDYNKILIDLLNKGLLSNNIKQVIQDNISLKINEQIKDIIKNELINYFNNNEFFNNKINNDEINNKFNNEQFNDELMQSINQNSNTLDLILNKLNDSNFVTNVNINKTEELQQKESEYDKHINNKEKINIDVDINPLLANILSNINK